MADRHTQSQTATFKRLLVDLKAEIETAMMQTVLDRAPVELDQQSVGRLSRMDALQMQAMSQAQQHKREVDLRRIHGALSRLEEGDYGICNICDEPIAHKRLEIDPAVSSCINCASS
ncbi:MAG: TraR/DksA family transcriptional regulator [Hyphomicrobiales bacterium]